MNASYAPIESLLESRTFKRLLVFSLAGHVALFLVLTFRPHSTATLISPSPVMVNVVDVPRPAAAAKPAAKKPAPPKPEAAPEPPKPKPVVKEVVIPKEPAPLAAKPKPKPVAKPEPAPKSAEELLAELTKKVEERNPPAPQAPPEPGPPAPMVGGPGVFDPLLSPWQARVMTAVRSNWSGAQLCKGVPVFNLEVAENGSLRDIELAETSGDRFCDESALRAILKSDPLPAPPRAVEIELRLNLKDSL